VGVGVDMGRCGWLWLLGVWSSLVAGSGCWWCFFLLLALTKSVRPPCAAYS
jgi:hypothetical protein